MNNNNMRNKEIIFSITKEDLQNEAIRRIGRKLNEDEFYTASKGIDWGLSFDIETVFKSAIEEAMDKNRQTECWRF